MKNYKTGIFVGKFFPLHNNHLNALNKICQLCEKVYLFFYNHEKIEEKLNLEGYIYYPIDKRIEDAKKICSTKNVTVVDFKVNKDYFFSTDYLKLKEDLFNQLKVNEIDLQIFGEDDEENYKDYIYANNYITCPHTKLSSIYFVIPFNTL